MIDQVEVGQELRRDDLKQAGLCVSLFTYNAAVEFHSRFLFRLIRKVQRAMTTI